MNLLYQLFNKGSYRTLSFIVALILTLCFFLNINNFSSQLRVASPYWVRLLIWSTVILWIHGIGLDIRHIFWKTLFNPIWAYVTVITLLIDQIAR